MRRRQCKSGKRCFASRMAAVNYGTGKMLKAGVDDKTGYVRPYYHHQCGWWHFTSGGTLKR